LAENFEKVKINIFFAVKFRRFLEKIIFRKSRLRQKLWPFFGFQPLLVGFCTSSLSSQKQAKMTEKGSKMGFWLRILKKSKLIFFSPSKSAEWTYYKIFENLDSGRSYGHFKKKSGKWQVLLLLLAACCLLLLLAWYEVADHPKVQFTHLDLPNRKTERGMCRKQRGDPRGGLDWPCSRLLMCLPLAPGPTQTQILRVKGH
jgi:hypothetical protein